MTVGNGTAEPFSLVCLAEVDPVPIDWEWQDYLARGKITLIGGDPDMGKSQVAIDAAARISTGSHWPNGARARKGSTIFLCSEDGVADTVRPRAEAAGADLSKLHVLSSTLIGSDRKPKRVTLQHDLNVLEQVIKHVGDVRLVSIDPITSYMGKIDGSSTNDVRAVLDPVSEFAEARSISLLAITHPPKNAQGNALRQFTGSFSYVAAARLGFFTIREPESDRLLLLPVKNNLGPKARGIGYRIGVKQISNRITAPHILWDDAPVDFTADQALAAASAARRDGGAIKEAKEFLSEFVGSGPVLATEAEEAANAHGISERTLRRARKDLGIKAAKTGFQGAWEWTL